MAQQSVDRAVDQARYYAAGHWQSRDLWESLAEAAAQQTGRTAFIAEGASLSYGDLVRQAQAVAGGLVAQGVSPGDVVVIHGRNSIESVLALLGCLCLGAIAAPLPPMFSVEQVARICESASAVAVIALGDAAERGRALAGGSQAASVRRRIAVGESPEGTDVVNWEVLLQAPPYRRLRATDPDALALLVYSSGTTGAPKGVMHSSNTVRYAARQRAQLHGVGADDVALVVSQFGFVGSIVFGLLLGPLAGATTVLMREWSGDAAIRLIERYRISYGLMMPTHVHDVLNSDLLDGADVSSFARCSMGGLTRERRWEVQRRLCPQPLPAYGMSECLGYTTCTLGEREDKLFSTDGHPYPGTETIIVDEEGEALGSGVNGMILVRGPSRFLGYYGATALTRSALTDDGFFRTGDIGWTDTDGYIGFVARQNDIIRRGGVTIVPGDLERVLATHPRIEHAAVVAVPDDRLGERACACLISRDGRPISLDEVTRFLAERNVARYTWPESVAMFESFPRSASLKVRKSDLIEELAQRRLV